MANPSLHDEVTSGDYISKVRLKSGAVQTIGNSGTIEHNNKNMARVTTAGAVTGVIVRAGVRDGQLLFIENTSANTLTAAAAGTSNVRAGTSFVIAANSLAALVWNSADGRWTGMI